MKKEELKIILNRLREGEIFYSQDRTYSYSGDIIATVIKYDINENCFLSEMYELTPNGDFCTRSEKISTEKMQTYIGKSFEEVKNKLIDKAVYKFVK